MTNEDGHFRPRPVDHLIIQNLDDELLIYDTSNNKAHCLNSSLRAVWEQCDGNRSLPDIVANLQKTYGRQFSSDHVRLALKQLRSQRLLQNDLPNSKLKGISRRDVVRKIGRGALAAVPLIASVAIPTPAEAASCFSLGHLCSSGSQCCSGHCGVSGVSLVCLP